MTSTDRMLTVLRRGVNLVQQAIESVPQVGIGYDRVNQLLDISRRITWTYEEKGSILAAEESTVTEVQVSVLSGSLPSGLDPNSTFQTREEDDGYTRVFVQRRPYTPTWAGIVLFHELDHLLDHLDGTWPRNATTEDWWDAEVRAYHREFLVIDAVSGGRMLPAVNTLLSATTVDELLNLDPPTGIVVSRS